MFAEAGHAAAKGGLVMLESETGADHWNRAAQVRGENLLERSAIRQVGMGKHLLERADDAGRESGADERRFPVRGGAARELCLDERDQLVGVFGLRALGSETRVVC